MAYNGRRLASGGPEQKEFGFLPSASAVALGFITEALKSPAEEGNENANRLFLVRELLRQLRLLMFGQSVIVIWPHEQAELRAAAKMLTQRYAEIYGWLNRAAPAPADRDQMLYVADQQTVAAYRAAKQDLKVKKQRRRR